jgi:hypothetical protein
MKTGAKIAIGVGVVAVAAAMIYKMRNGKKVMLPVMPTGNQQPATALPSPKKSPVVNPIEPTPIVNRPIDRPIYDAPVYTPIFNRPIYDAPIYDQEYRGRGRNIEMAGLSHLLR